MRIAETRMATARMMMMARDTNVTGMLCLLGSPLRCAAFAFDRQQEPFAGLDLDAIAGLQRLRRAGAPEFAQHPDPTVTARPFDDFADAAQQSLLAGDDGAAA